MSKTLAYSDEHELELFLSDDEQDRQQIKAEYSNEPVFGLLSRMPTNEADEISIHDLKVELSKLPPTSKASTLIDILSGLTEESIPKDAVTSMWAKISNPCDKATKKRRVKSANAVSVVRSRLLESKRKQAECDLKLLQNRIFLLQQEESKAWKKILQTKDRAKEILEQREAHIKKQEEKTYHAFEREKQARKIQKKQHSLKKESMIKKKHAAIQVISKKYQDVEEVKNESKRLKAEKEKQQMLEVERAKEKREAIRKQEEALKKKKEQEKEQHEKQVALRYMKKVIDEERKIREHQKRVEEMEKAELKLIKRLQGTQLIQKEAYTVLEQALLRTDAMPGGEKAATT